jgi:type II secretory pathway pseudopilin PulG
MKRDREAPMGILAIGEQIIMRYRASWKGLRTKRISCGGFSLIETLIAMSVLFIALAGIISANISSMRLRQVNGEKALARNAAERVFSAIRGMPGLVEAYQRFGGGGSEETFDVRGLQDPAPGQPVGRVIIWRRKNSLQNQVNPPQPDPGSALALSQDEILEAQATFLNNFPNAMDRVAGATGTGWNDYVDTNNNGSVELGDDPQLMPVTLRIRWRSRTGVSTQYFSAIIGRR